MKRQQQGFTLIELVIVIVILGILSAFALPRFADLSGDARSASIEGLAGSMKSATGIVRSACLASSSCDQSSPSGETVELSGETINVAFGYPSAEEAGIGFAAQVSSSDYVPTGSWGSSGAGESVELTVQGGSGGATCAATYSAATSSGSSLGSPASVSTDVSGC